jgi:aryl-phospho-beta-D-glucosidase BglC (GH1 family)
MKILLPALLVSVLIGCKKNTPSNHPGNTTTPREILSKGVNLSNWFNDYSDVSQFSNRFSLSTLQFIKSNGFTYVRIPIGVTSYLTPTSPINSIPPTYPM